MVQSVNANGWVVDDGNIILCPVVGFKVKPAVGGTCALQFNYFANNDAVEKNEVQAVQLLMPLDAIEKLRKVLQDVEEQLRSRPAGAVS